MASLLRHWLNHELALPRQVDVLERDLSNGVVFAHVLHAFGLESRLEQYDDRMDTTAKMRNLELLAPSLEAAGIAFPLRTRRAILMEDRSAVLQLLLQLKDTVQKRSKQHSGSSSSSSATRVHAVQSRVYESARKRESEQPVIRDVEERFVVETAQRLQPKELAFRKDVDMAVHLRRFEQAQWTAENALADVRPTLLLLLARVLDSVLTHALAVACSVPRAAERGERCRRSSTRARGADASQRQARVHQTMGQRAPEQVERDTGAMSVRSYMFDLHAASERELSADWLRCDAMRCDLFIPSAST